MDQKHFEHIENYILGRLSEVESNEFTSNLRDDESLREDLEEVRLMLGASQSSGLKVELDAIHDELYGNSENAKQKHLWKYVSGIAATVALLLLWYFSSNNSTPDRNLFYSYFEPFPNYVTSRNPGLEASDRTRAFLHYSKGEFRQAIDAFERLEVKNEDSMFHLAISYLGNDEVQKAIENLSKTNQLGSKYDQQITWYLALSYLKEEDHVRALAFLRKISEQDYKYQEAREIISRLE